MQLHIHNNPGRSRDGDKCKARHILFPVPGPHFYSCCMCSYKQSSNAQFLPRINLQPTVFHQHRPGWASSFSSMTENRQFIRVCYQSLPHILSRHVCQPIWAYHCTRRERKQTQRTHSTTENTWLHTLLFRRVLKMQVAGKPGSVTRPVCHTALLALCQCQADFVAVHNIWASFCQHLMG